MPIAYYPLLIAHGPMLIATMNKLAIITSHPIQYNAPLFKLLAERGQIQLKVFYTWGKSVLENKFDPGFNRTVEWDVPLLEGYDYEFLENISSDKGTHHFKGIINPAIVQRIDEYSPDAILVYGWSFYSHLKVLRAFHKKVPVLFRGDSTLLGKPKGWKQVARRLFLTWVYQKIDYALYPGTRNYEYYLHAGVPKHKLLHAPHAIDNDRFSIDDKNLILQALRLREQEGIPAGAFVFLFAGKLDDNKNAATLIHAFLAGSLPDHCHLVIVGNGELESTLKSRYSRETKIRFMPFQNQSAMPVIYRMADVFVLPSKSETWGLAVNEAMASGCAILMSEQSGGAIDLIRPGKNGFTFNVHDKKDLEEKLLTLSADRVRVAEMGRQSKKIINHFSFEKVAETIESIVRQVGKRYTPKPVSAG